MRIISSRVSEPFRKLMEKHFLDGPELTEKLVKKFRKELKELELDLDLNREEILANLTELEKLDLKREDILANLVRYFSEVYSTARMRTTRKRLHTDRDYGLEIYVKVFADLVAGAKSSPTRKVDFILFLTGITETPYTNAPLAERLVRIAKSEETVLITGETGTGKELHAKAIHHLSPRAKERFTALNCAGIPETLLESELFGHEKGSFTGAIKPKKGILEQAGRGTLFLDEIGDMPMALQAKLLRVLQSGDYRRVGGTDTLHFDGRVIAATNRDLRKEISKPQPEFRTDLYYRLNVLTLMLPPLRSLSETERRMAILNKLQHVLRLKSDQMGFLLELNTLETPSGTYMVSDEYGAGIELENPYIAEGAIRLLSQYNFPGNYRELNNIILRAYTLTGGEKIEEELLRNEIDELREIEPTEGRNGETGTETIHLRDIIDHANKTRARIVRRRIEAVYRSGHNLKEALAAEGETSDIGYQKFRNRVENIIGRGEIGRIKKTYGRKQGQNNAPL